MLLRVDLFEEFGVVLERIRTYIVVGQFLIFDFLVEDVAGAQPFKIFSLAELVEHVYLGANDFFSLLVHIIKLYVARERGEE